MLFFILNKFLNFRKYICRVRVGRHPLLEMHLYGLVGCSHLRLQMHFQIYTKNSFNSKKIAKHIKKQNLYHKPIGIHGTRKIILQAYLLLKKILVVRSCANPVRSNLHLTSITAIHWHLISDQTMHLWSDFFVTCLPAKVFPD